MHKRSKSRGVAIPTVLFVLVIVLIIGVAITATGIQNLRNSQLNRWNKEAFYAAEAGLARAIDRIKAENDWNGHETDGTLTFENVVLSPGTEDMESTYTVYVCNHFRLSPTPQPVHPEIARYISGVPNYNTYILAEGKAGNGKAVRRVGTMLRFEDFYPFRSALFGDSMLNLNNVNLYAYDSSTGTYNLVHGEANAGVNGSGWTSGAVALARGNAYLDGYVYLSTLVHGIPGIVDYGGTVQPEAIRLTKPQPMNSVEIPSGLTPRTLPPGKPTSTTLLPGDYTGQGEIDLRNNTVTLKGPGTFIIDGFNLNGNDDIVIDNPTNDPIIIYTRGDIDGTGNSSLGFQTSDSIIKPYKVQIYGTDDCKMIAARGNSKCGYVAYAPKSSIYLKGNVTFYGALVGNTIDISGNSGQFFYDICTAEVAMPDKPIITSTSWQRF
jgi:Tfp pilus assembly protein PilX